MSERDDLSDTVKRAIHDILQYVTQHPAARDTLAGIRDWWLRPRSSYATAELQEALDTLTGWGWLVQQTLVSRTVVYSMSAAALGAANEFLRKAIDQG